MTISPMFAPSKSSIGLVLFFFWWADAIKRYLLFLRFGIVEMVVVVLPLWPEGKIVLLTAR